MSNEGPEEYMGGDDGDYNSDMPPPELQDKVDLSKTELKVGEFVPVVGHEDNLSVKILSWGPGGGGDDAAPRPKIGDWIKAHYTGTVEADGNPKFDSSRDRGEPFETTIGVGQVIKGWDVGFRMLTKGTRAVLRIKSDYGYGAAGSPPKIPGGATLLFDVELLEFSAKKPESIAPGIVKMVQTEGKEYKHPQLESKLSCTVSIDGGDSKTLDIECLGAEELPVGLEEALCSLKGGEVATFTFSPQQSGANLAQMHSFVFDGKTAPKTNDHDKKDADFSVQISMAESLTVVPTWGHGKDKVKMAEERKARANTMIAKPQMALKWYDRALAMLGEDIDYGLDGEPELISAAKALRCVICSNMSLMWARLGNSDKALRCANDALAVDAAHPKALFRKAQALDMQEEYDDAVKILRMLPAEDAGVQQQLEATGAKKKARDAKQRAAFSKMFS